MGAIPDRFTPPAGNKNVRRVGLRIPTTGGFPEAPALGDIVYRLDLEAWFGWNGTIWREFTLV